MYLKDFNLIKLMNKKERYITEKGIEHLSQLQENEKFKLDVKINTIQNLLLGAIAFWIGLLSVGVMIAISGGGNTQRIFSIISTIPFFSWCVYWIYENNKMRKIKKEIQRIEEKIKKMYGQLGVNVNKLK